MNNFLTDDFDPTREYFVTFNGADVPVEVELEAEGISVQQREALQLLFSLPGDVLKAATPAVMQNYEVYQEAVGEEELPSLENPLDLWKLVVPTSFHIPLHGDVTTPTFFLLAECDWDPEHGLTVRFRNGRADAASQQGELGIED